MYSLLFSPRLSQSTKHSKNKIITYFENKVGPGVLQSNVQQYTICKSFTKQGQNRHIISCTWFVTLVFLQHSCLLSAGLEHSRSNLVFKQPRLHNNLIFGMLYWFQICALFWDTSRVKNCSVLESGSYFEQAVLKQECKII